MKINSRNIIKIIVFDKKGCYIFGGDYIKEKGYSREETVRLGVENVYNKLRDMGKFSDLGKITIE